MSDTLNSTIAQDTLARVKAVLFPPPEQVKDRHFVDASADENLEAVIYDLESRNADAVCIKSLRKILVQLTEARNVITEAIPNE